MQFDAPSPQQRSGHDFSANPLGNSQPITYRAGTLEEAAANMFFDGKMDSEYMTQGFEYYDKEAQARAKIPAFTAYVLGVYYGSFSNGQGKGDIRFFSNLVTDTKTDVMQSSYFMNDQRKTLAIGNYKTDIVPALEKEGRKGGFTRVIVAYIAELKEIRAIHLGATAEAGFVKAIAKARDMVEAKASLYGLSDLRSEIWVFKYDGESEPVVFSDRDAKNVPATVPAKKGNKKIYFQPVLEAGVIRQTSEKYNRQFTAVSAMQDEFTAYLQSEQEYFNGLINKGKETQTPPAGYDPNNAAHAANPFDTSGGVPFPTTDLTDHETAAQPDDEMPF